MILLTNPFLLGANKILIGYYGSQEVGEHYLQNPAMDKASMLDSVPPATMTSASPK